MRISKITIARDALAPALVRAAALVPSRITIPIVACAMIEVGPDGLAISATDLDTWYTEFVDAEPREPWSGCVDAVRLHGFVHSLAPGSPVELTADDRALTITAAGARARLGVLPSDDFPTFAPPEEGAVFAMEPTAFSAALRFVAPSIGKEETRRYLCGAFLDPEGRLVTTDGNRLAAYRLAASLPAFEGVILPLPPQRLLPLLLKGFADAVMVTVTPRVIGFSNGSWTLTSKLVDGTYPDWRSVLPARSETPIVVEAAALRAAVDRIAATCRIPNTRMSAARLRLSSGELCVSAVTDTADAEVETIIAAAGGPGDDIEIGLSTRYLAEALGVIEAEQVELHIPSDRHRAVCVCGAGEAENGIAIAPMRV
jgi:DNA polymerase-3 subunit beta